jgi:hypothetical protein
MASSERYIPRPQSAAPASPFETAEEAWFWFIAAQEARVDGARFTAGIGLVPRPCEPIDILKVIDGLYRNRRLMRDHLLVLRHYGRRRLPPDERRVKELRAHTLWHEALERIGAVLEGKGIVRPAFQRFFNWHEEALVYSGVAAE